MTERDARERDILVAANEYAYVQDLTKGDIVLMQNTIELRRLDHEARMSQTEREAELARRAQEAGVVAFERQMAALAPELIATLRTLGNQQLAAELSKNVSPLAILGGTDVAGVVEKLIGNLPIGAKTSVAEVVRGAAAPNNGRPVSRSRE